MSCKKINFPSGINTIPILPQPVMLLLENLFIYDNLMPLWNYNMFVCTKARPQEDSPAKLCLCLPNKLNSRCLLGSLSASFHAFLVKLHWTLLHFDSPTQQTPQSFLDGQKKAPQKTPTHKMLGRHRLLKPMCAFCVWQHSESWFGLSLKQNPNSTPLSVWKKSKF